MFNLQCHLSVTMQPILKCQFCSTLLKVKDEGNFTSNYLLSIISLSWKNRHCQRAEFKLFFMAGMGYRMMPRLDDAKAEALATFRFLYHLTIMKFEGVINLKVEQCNS